MCGVWKEKEKNIKVYQSFNGENYASKYSGTTIFKGTNSSHFNDGNI